MSMSARYSAARRDPPSPTGAPAAPPPAYHSAVAESSADAEGKVEITYRTETEPPVGGSRPRFRARASAIGMKQPLIIVGVIVGIIAVIVVIIVPMSYSTLEYYEYGFKRRKSSGLIDRSVVYGPGGRHFLGPDYEFRTMSAEAHYETFNRVTVFAKDRLEVSITAHMQYFLRGDQIRFLHLKYDTRYRPILLTNALNALKNRATDFETREFIRNRTYIENQLFKAVRDVLSGPCCEKGCKRSGSSHRKCMPDCKTTLCSENEYGFYVDVRYFQLDGLQIPSDLEAKFLRGLVLTEETEGEKYKQNATIVRKETDAKVKQIQNEAREISQEATAQSDLLRAVANANATSIVETARSDGLKFLYHELAITDQKQKASFDYLRTLRGQENVFLAVDFQQLIAGNL